MLERLVIRDLALVDRAEIAFGRGLSAVTGETGAGKSLTVEALALLVGGRADADIVREGAEGCGGGVGGRRAGGAAPAAGGGGGGPGGGRPAGPRPGGGGGRTRAPRRGGGGNPAPDDA